MKIRAILQELFLFPALALLALSGACHHSGGSGHVPQARMGPIHPSPRASAELPLVSLPGQVALGPAGKSVLVAQPILGRILEVDTADQSTRVVTTTPGSPWGLKPMPDGRTYLVTDSSSDRLLLLDPAKGWERMVQIPFSGTPFVAVPSRDGSWAAVVFVEGFLAVVPLSGGPARRIEAGLQDPWGAALEPGEETLLVAERGLDQLTRVRLSDGAVQKIAGNLKECTDVFLETGNGSALAASDTGDVYRVDLRAGTVQVFRNLPGAVTLAAGPDLGTVLVGDYENGKVYTLDRIKGGATILVDGIGEPTWMGVAGPSSLVLVDQTALGGLFLVEWTEGLARPTLLVENGREMASVCVLPGGKRAALTTGSGRLYLVPLDGKDPVLLNSHLLEPSAVSVSMDGKTLYLSERKSDPLGTYSRLTAVDLASGKAQGLTGFSLPEPVHATGEIQKGLLVVRDAKGVRLFDLVAGTFSPPGYIHLIPSTTGMAYSWPDLWVAWSSGDRKLDFEIDRLDLSLGSGSAIEKGSGLQPVGMGLTPRGDTLLVVDLAGGTVVRFLP